MSEQLDFTPPENDGPTECHWCGSTPRNRRDYPGYRGCRFCAPNDFSDQHAAMTAVGMAKLSKGIRYRKINSDGSLGPWQE